MTTVTFEEELLSAIERDDYDTLSSMAQTVEDDELAAEIRQYAAVAHRNCWGHDEDRDNHL